MRRISKSQKNIEGGQLDAVPVNGDVNVTVGVQFVSTKERVTVIDLETARNEETFPRVSLL